MPEPMYCGFHLIVWSAKRQEFIVRHVNGNRILFHSHVGKECYDWALARENEGKQPDLDEGEEE